MRRVVSQPMVTLAAVLVELLVELLVVWGASPWAEADPMVLSLVLLALAAACGAAAVRMVLTPSFGLLAPVRAHHDTPLRRGRPTDPTHHPLAPRAPGPA